MKQEVSSDTGGKTIFYPFLGLGYFSYSQFPESFGKMTFGDEISKDLCTTQKRKLEKNITFSYL